MNKELLKREESMKIGTFQRTTRTWKRNGNLKTMGKTLMAQNGDWYERNFEARRQEAERQSGDALRAFLARFG